MLRGLLNGVTPIVHAVAVGHSDYSYGVLPNDVRFLPLVVEQNILDYNPNERGAVALTEKYLPLCGAPVSSLMPVRMNQWGKSRLPLTTRLKRITCPACLVAVDEMLESGLIALETGPEWSWGASEVVNSGLFIVDLTVDDEPTAEDFDRDYAQWRERAEDEDEFDRQDSNWDEDE